MTVARTAKLASYVLMCVMAGDPTWAVGFANQEPAQDTQAEQNARDAAQAQAQAQANADAQARVDAAQAKAEADAQARINAAILQIRTNCGVSDSETDPKAINKQSDCVARAVSALRRKINTENALRAAAARAYGAPAVAGVAQPGSRVPAPPPVTLHTPTATPQPSYVGASASGTPSTCGPGTGANNPLIRVHRLLMAPKNASDDFGYRLGRRFFVYQVTIENHSTDHQFLLHDVSIDLSPLFGADPGTYLYTASSQDLTLLRGIPEKGQDLDKRNLTLHVLQGIGSVAAGISGLSAFSDVMGSSVAVFNGPFLQGYVGIAPDHTATQLNRLSDSAYITNTLIEKQRAKSIAMFIPEATLLTKQQQNLYWKQPYNFLEGVLNLDQADVCVDGAFITTVATPPTLSSATVAAKASGTKIGPSVDAVLTIRGTNLVVGDTQIVGLGPNPLTLTTANGTTGSVDVTLPADFKIGLQVHLVSAANPSFVSGNVAVTTTAPGAPTLTSAILTPKAKGTTLAAGVQATLAIQGTNLVLGDTQVIGLGPTVTLATASGTAGSVDVTLPKDYKSGMQIHLASASDPSLTSAPLATSTGSGTLTLTRATLEPKKAGTKLGPNVAALLKVEGTNISLGDTEVAGLGSPMKLTTATATTGSVELTLPADYKEGLQVHLASAADPTVTSAAVTLTASTPSGPTIKKAVLKPKVGGTKLAPGVPVTLTVQGTNLIQGDTQVVGLGPTVLLDVANGTSGTVALSLPADYKDGMPVHLLSKLDPTLVSKSIATSTSAPVAPKLTKAVLNPKTAGTKLGPGVQVTLSVQGTNLIPGDTQVIGFGSALALKSVKAGTGSVDLALPADYKDGMPVYLTSAANPSLKSAEVATTSKP